jgi:hypothetical protein
MEGTMRDAFHRISLAVVVWLITASGAMAAPQVLGMVASVAPTALTCVDGTCAAEFSTFCLQKDRVPPRSGTVYEVAKGADLTLVVTAADGTVRRVPAANVINVTSARAYTAVTVSIPERDLLALGGRRAAIVAGERVSLVPRSDPEDPWPLTGHDITYATGPLRAGAANLFDTEGENPVAARITNRLINAIPVGARLSPAERKRLWGRVMGGDGDRATGAGGRAAARIFGACRGLVDMGSSDSLRGCLEKQHDGIILDMNSRYWMSIGAGS